MHSWIGQSAFGADTGHDGYTLVARIQDLFGRHAVHHSIQLPRLHLPDVESTIGAGHHQKIIERAPLDVGDGEEVARGQEDALALLQADQRHRMIFPDAANALLYSRLK